MAPSPSRSPVRPRALLRVTPAAVGPASPLQTGQQHGRNSGSRCCSRRAVFAWSAVLFLVSLMVVNVSFASAYRSMQGFKSYVRSTVSSQRTVLQLRTGADTGEAGPLQMTSVDQSDVDLPINATASEALAAAGATSSSDGGAADWLKVRAQQGPGGGQQRAAGEAHTEQEPAGSAGNSVATAAAAAAAAAARQLTPTAQQDPEVAAPRQRSKTGHTLVVYVFQNRDSESVANFEYFLANGIVDVGVVDYVIVVQHLQAEKFVPEGLPGEVVVEEYPGCTAPWGVYGWAVDRYDAPTYKHYVMLTSAMAGPFLPPYIPEYRWVDAFTSRLKNGVKMVGPMISCQAIAKGGDGNGDWRTNPHVTQEMVVVDRQALALIKQAGDVMQCYSNPFDAKYFGESGAARVLLDAGHNLDSLMLKHQGIDWTDKANWHCLSGIRPNVDLVYDGVFVNPLETIFVEVTLGFVANEFPQARLARKYADWQKNPDPVKNEWQDNHWPAKAPKLAVTNARGPGCFDNNFYKAHNPDLAALDWQPWELWEHFITAGQFQGRPFRFSCDMMVGESYMIAYFKHRGPACFDFDFYKRENPDVDYMDDKYLWIHFTGMGQFEPRDFRFNCNVDFIMAGQELPPGGLRTKLYENATEMAMKEEAKKTAATGAAEEASLN